MPRIEALWKARGDDGLQVVAVNIDAGAPRQRMEAMISSWGLTMPQWQDPEDGYTVHFEGLGVPMTVLLDRDGRLVRRWQGAVDPTGVEFQAAIDRVLAPHQG